MIWKQLLAKGEVKPHQTSKQELDSLRKLLRVTWRRIGVDSVC